MLTKLLAGILLLAAGVIGLAQPISLHAPLTNPIPSSYSLTSAPFASAGCTSTISRTACANTNTYLIFDRDAKFGGDVQRFLDSAGISAIRTSYRSPWQNGVAISSIRV